VASGLAVALATLGGCGIQSEDRAQRFDDDKVPFELLDENSGVDPSDELGNQDVSVYLARGGRLIQESRSIQPPVSLTGLLRSLRRGPTREEAAAGIRTALPDENAVQSARLEGGLATVDLTEALVDLPTGDQGLALGQIVWTLTGIPGVGQVRFTRDGASVEVPRPDGTLTSDPVSRDDYAALVPLG
jgi:spore germination protein GerM